MKLTSHTGVLFVSICIGILSAQAVHAAHATSFLDALYSEVTNRLANPGDNTAVQNAALRSASKTLARDTKHLGADVSALATAAKTLDKRFPGDETLSSLENDALAAYTAEAEALLDEAAARIGTNDIPRGLLKQLMKAEAALNAALASTNGVPERARALAKALNKMRRPVAKVFMMFQEPTPPTPTFEAPTEIPTPKNLTLTETAPSPSETTIFYFHTKDDTGARFLHYSSHNPEELGTWTYTRTSSTTAVVHCNVDFAEPGGTTAPHDFMLTFTGERVGTFTGRNTFMEPIQGTFFIDP